MFDSSSPEWRPPPELPKNPKLDFSQFHDLMHLPFSRHCFAQYGGPRHHLALDWDLRKRPALRAATRCRVGLHTPSQVYRMHERKAVATFVVCSDCGKQLAKEQPV